VFETLDLSRLVEKTRHLREVVSHFGVGVPCPCPQGAR
jgi:hypothetical protein